MVSGWQDFEVDVLPEQTSLNRKGNLNVDVRIYLFDGDNLLGVKTIADFAKEMIEGVPTVCFSIQKTSSI